MSSAMRILSLLWCLGVGLSGCTELMVGSHLYKKASNAKSCITEGAIKVGSPYIVDGERYEPQKSSLGYTEKGIASWYGKDFHGKASANGECYNMYAYTAAHKTLPLPTVVRVTNLENGRSIVLKVNDRGPYVRGRIIDLSYAAAQSLDVVRTGTAPVLVEAIGGPHHVAGGYRGGNTKFATKLGPRDEVAETLPTVVPTASDEESLTPLAKGPKPDVQRATEKFKARQAAMVAQTETAMGVPAPNTALPKPPAYEKQVATDTTPLTHTQVFVQVGAYSDLTRATTQKDKLAKIYPTIQSETLQTAYNGPLLRVRAGPFRSVADAEAALDVIVKSGFNGARIQVEGGELTPPRRR